MKHCHFRTALLAASLASAFVALAVVSFQKSFTASHAQLSGGGTYLIDDTDPRFSKGGYWFPFFLNYAYNGQMKIGRKTTNPRARWLYSELRAGTYEVWVTWVPHGTFASNAPFTVRVSGQVEPRTVLIDQRRMPEQQMGNTRWQSLGIHSVSEGTLEVILTDQGIDNWFIVADAVRIVPVEEPPRSSSSRSSSSSSSSQHYEYFCNGTWQSTPCSSSSSSVSSSISSAGSLTSTGWQGCGNDICGAFIANNQCNNSGHVDCNAPGGGMTSGTPTGQSCGVPGCTGQCFRCPTVSSAYSSSSSSPGSVSSSISSAGSLTSTGWQGCGNDICGAFIANNQCNNSGHVDCNAPGGGMTSGTPTGQSCGVPGCTGQCFRCPTVSSSSSVSSTAPGTDLSVSAPAIQPATLQPGRSNTITWPVTNSGTPVANVQLAATIPQGVMFNGGDGRCQRNGAQVICTIAQMAAVQTVPLLLGFTLEQGMSCGGSVLFSATVSSGKQDVNPGNNTAEVTVQKECNSTDLSVSTHTMDPENVPYGGASTFRWKMKNNGEQTATNAALNLTIPQGFSFFGGNASCQIMGTNRIQCLKTTLAPGEEIEYAIGIRFPGGSTGNSIFRLYVAADQADPNALNNIWNGQVQTSMTVIQQ